MLYDMNSMLESLNSYPSSETSALDFQNIYGIYRDVCIAIDNAAAEYYCQLHCAIHKTESLNAKTGLFSKRMKIIHQDPVLQAQRVAAIKKAKGTDAARKQASDTMIAFFSNPENRLKRSIAMKGVKFYCSYCGEEGHRRHYCPTLRNTSGTLQLTCRQCGERGHNRRTCGRLTTDGEPKRSRNLSNTSRSCSVCGQSGHYCRTCPELTQNRKVGDPVSQVPPLISKDKKTHLCSLCLVKGHNSRTCPNKKTT